jgi:copper(I)-binding protein
VTRRAAVVAKLVLPVLLGFAALTGCGAGALTQTAQQAPAVNGYQGRAGTIDVRDATIAFAGQGNSGAVYRAGQSAPLNMVLVNVGDTTDRLVSVSSPVASSGQIQGEAILAGGRAVQVGNDDARADATSLADRTISIQLVGLNQDIKPGLKYPVVFTFERGGVLAAELPVGYPTGQLAERK